MRELIREMDSYLDLPVREVDKPVYLPIEQAVSIPGRGTVVLGRLERGVLKKGDDAEIRGLDRSFKTTVTSIYCLAHSTPLPVLVDICTGY